MPWPGEGTTPRGLMRGTGYQASPFQHRAAAARGGRAGAWVTIEGAVDAARLRDVVRNLVWTHEILRTRLETPAGLAAPVQVIETEVDPVVRLRAARPGEDSGSSYA